jgi:hypothetical protein
MSAKLRADAGHGTARGYQSSVNFSGATARRSARCGYTAARCYTQAPMVGYERQRAPLSDSGGTVPMAGRDLLKKPESDERRAFPAVRVRRHSKEQVICNKPSCERNVGVTWTHEAFQLPLAHTQKSEQRCQKFQLHY